MKSSIWLLAAAVLIGGLSCSFHPFLDTENYWPCGPDGLCNEGCSCIDGQVCVPDDSSADADCKWCPEGKADCNEEVADGCEIEFRTDEDNWCACGMPCDEQSLCQGNQCVWECGSDLSECEGWCVNLMGDPDNCGSCGNECDHGQVCNQGWCAGDCSEGLENCDGSCADLGTDPDHCGECGNDCGQWYTCCEASCLKVKDDEQNCGGCDVQCPPQQMCDHMECRECVPPEEFCAGACHDTTSCDTHCGGCEIVCEDGQTCENGVCVNEDCPDGHASCSGVCVNLQENHFHCGECDLACGDEQKCEAGNCVDICGPNQMLCGDMCVDINHDQNHCGGCNQPCTSPPASECDSGGQNQVDYGTQGDCMGGECEYPATTVPCDFGCKNGQCQGDPCGEVNCTIYEDCIDGECLCKVGDGICQSDYICCAQGCTNLMWDSANCSECGHECAGFAFCENGICMCGADGPCADGQRCCQTGCADLMSNNQNCGQCGIACGEQAYCHMGQCKCQADYGNCDTEWFNGCEEYLVDNFTHCGVCARECNQMLPPPECIDAGSLLRYLDTICMERQCGFITDTEWCEWGCHEAACNPDPCDSVTCDSQWDVCDDGICYCGYEGGEICEGGTFCCESECVDLQNDAGHCGDCFTACVSDISCNEGQCGKLGVECAGGIICDDVMTEHVCCAPGSNDAGCAMGNECSIGLVECDGPEDCTGDRVVCCHADMMTSHFTQCMPDDMCLGTYDGSVLCNSNWQCEGMGLDFSCCPFPVFGLNLHLCSDQCK